MKLSIRARLSVLPALLLPLSCGGHDAALARRNLLLISVDTLRADHLSPYGMRIETPAIQRLADEGVLFEQAFSPVPLTQPAHTSLFTGNYPGRHGVRDNVSFALSGSAHTLAERFQAAGYQTGAVVAATVLTQRTGLGQGFADYDDHFSAAQINSGLPVVERSGDEVRDRSLGWLSARERDRPFFLFVHFYDPHTPYTVPPDLLQRYGSRPYAAEVVRVDRCVDALLAALERDGVLDQTLVVFLSDHGEALGDHGEATHGLFLYEAATHVPLVMRLPGALPAGLRLSEAVSLVDVMPTLLELYGLDAPPMDGRSLVPLLRGGSLPERDLLAETLYPLFYRWSPSFSLRRGRHKYILSPEAELYDLASDPGEQDNLVAREPELAGRLEAAVESRLRRWEESASTAEQAGSQQSMQALAALGYAAGAAVDPSSAGPLPDMKERVALYEELSEAMGLMRERRWKEAGERFASLLDSDPGNPSIHLNLGECLAQQADFQGAEEHFRTCLEIAPENRMAKSSLGMLYFSWRRLDQARKLFEEVLAAAPSDPQPLFVLGQIHELQGDPAGALELYDAAGELMPQLPGLEERKRAVRQSQSKR